MEAGELPLGTEQIWLHGTGSAFASLSHEMRVCFSDFAACLWFAKCHTLLPALRASLPLYATLSWHSYPDRGKLLHSHTVVLETPGWRCSSALAASGPDRDLVGEFFPDMLLALLFCSLDHVTRTFLFLCFMGLEVRPG